MHAARLEHALEHALPQVALQVRVDDEAAVDWPPQ